MRGITTCFANPGTSEMQLVYEIGMTDKVRPVLCLQEDVVTGAADGYARMKGAPAFTLLHVASGFANGIAMLHNAGRANTPIVNVVGANASYHQPNYPEHELINGRITDLARVVSALVRTRRTTPLTSANSARRRRRSRKRAGMHHRSADQLSLGRGQPAASPSRAAAGRKTSAEAIAHAATMLENGKKTGLVLGNLAIQGDALEIAARVAAKTGAVVAMPRRFLRYHLSRGEGRPTWTRSLTNIEVGLKFLEPFQQ